MPYRQGRPVYLNLIKIRLPIPGIISIMHRVFGVLLSFAIPFFSYLFYLSLRSQSDFELALAWLGHPLVILLSAGLLWGLIHHLFAGIRYLLIDVEIGVEKQASVYSAWIVLIAGIVVTLLLLGVIWL